MIYFLVEKRKRGGILSHEASMDVNERGSAAPVFRFSRSQSVNRFDKKINRFGLDF